MYTIWFVLRLTSRAETAKRCSKNIIIIIIIISAAVYRYNINTRCTSDLSLHPKWRVGMDTRNPMHIERGHFEHNICARRRENDDRIYIGLLRAIQKKLNCFAIEITNQVLTHW